MFTSSTYVMMLGLFSVAINGMFLVAAIIVFRSIRNTGSILLLTGTIGKLSCGLFWFVSQHVLKANRPDYETWAASSLFQIMRAVGPLSSLIFAVGVILTVMEVGRAWRQNRILEDLMAGSLTDQGR